MVIHKKYIYIIILFSIMSKKWEQNSHFLMKPITISVRFFEFFVSDIFDGEFRIVFLYDRIDMSKSFWFFSEKSYDIRLFWKFDIENGITKIAFKLWIVEQNSQFVQSKSCYHMRSELFASDGWFEWRKDMLHVYFYW